MVEDLGRLGVGHHGVAPAMNVGDRGEQQPVGIGRPVDTDEINEAQDIAPVGTLGMGTGPPCDPAFELPATLA